MTIEVVLDETTLGLGILYVGPLKGKEVPSLLALHRLTFHLGPLTIGAEWKP